MPRFSLTYRVLSHEYVDDTLARVNLRCLGYPTLGSQPDEWPFSIKVPKGELSAWPIGSLVRLEVK